MLLQDVGLVESDDKDSFIALYMFDETDVNMYLQKLNDEQFVAGLIYIDNYEEALESIDDVRRSLFIGLIDKRVNKYFATGAAVVRVKIGNEMTLTLSIGIGTGADNYAGNYDLAKAAMDLALGRGGDQAVVKKGDKILYYGGKSQQMEKNTRVKVRVKAHALRQILDTTDNVLVMGHKSMWMRQRW